VNKKQIDSVHEELLTQNNALKKRIEKLEYDALPWYKKIL
jgi:hypothetical protein